MNAALGEMLLLAQTMAVLPMMPVIKTAVGRSSSQQMRVPTTTARRG